MNDKDKYIMQLENLILNILLPVFNKYYRLKGLPIPELNMPIMYSRKIPRLLEKQV